MDTQQTSLVPEDLSTRIAEEKMKFNNAIKNDQPFANAKTILLRIKELEKKLREFLLQKFDL